MIKVRFAPSPTGFLHVGNIRIALVNWLFARNNGGHFLLRLDDTDTDRSTEEYARAIEEDLSWLRLTWDSFFRQSDRMARYNEALESLKQAGRLYPCYETAEELERRRKLQLAQRKPPVYDRAALRLTQAQRKAYEDEGRRPHWRFKLDHEPTEWNDLIHGTVKIQTDSVSDPVLVREDGRLLYTVTSVVDDADTDITHIIRGEDHITNTAAQIQIFRALGATPPTFAHLALLTGASGEGLSKRTGSLSIRDMRAQGVEPMAILSLLARLGSSQSVEPHLRLQDLAQGFDVGHFSRAAAKFDMADVWRLNAAILHKTPYESVRGRIPADMTEREWNVLRANIERLDDVRDWHKLLRERLDRAALDLNDKPFFAQAIQALPPQWTDTSWKDWTNALKQSTGRSGKALFQPLRLALTGRDHGPDMQSLLSLMPREEILTRLKSAAE